jgi:CAAX protease family protein
VTAVAVSEHPGKLKAAGWAALFLATGFALMLVLSWLGAMLTGGLATLSQGPRALIIQTVAGLMAYGFMTWAIGMKGIGLTATDLRWAPSTRGVRGFGFGLLLGIVPALLALGLSILAGGAAFLPDSGGPGMYLTQMARTALILAPAALLEEIMFRGVGQVVLGKAFGRIPALVFLSVAFAAAHLGNPNGTPLALFNIALAGVLLGVAFYAPGGIWTAWGAHFGWNATLAAADAPVSGLPFAIPLIDYSPGGPLWLTGGSFGPEGGLLATVAISIATVAAWRWSRKELA